MNRLVRRIVPLFVMTLALLVTTAVTRAQVLKQVPADAMVVVKFNNLKQTSDRIAALADKFGIAQINPAVSDPLGNFKQAIGANNGINESGEAAIVVLSKEAADAGGAEGAVAERGPKKADIIVLLPVSDYKAFIGNYADAKTDGDLSVVNLPSNPDETAYIAHWGDYAAISTEVKTPLAKKPEGLAVAGMAAKQLADRDITIFANMKAVRERVLPELKKKRGEIKEKAQAELAKKNPQANEKFGNLAGTAIDQFINFAEQFLEQSQAATLGLSLTEDAIKSTGMLEFDPNSNWGKSIAEMKSSNKPLVSGLPDATFLVVSGYSFDPKAMGKLLDNVLGPIETELNKMGDEGKPFVTYLTAFRNYMTATTSGSGAWLAPTGALGQEAILQVAAVMKGDSQKILDSHRDMFNSQQAMMDVFGAKAEVQTSYTANAKTIDGVAFNQFSTTFGPADPAAEKTPQQMQMQQMMTWLYGPNGMNGYAGALDKETVIVASGVSDEMMSKVIAAAKANDTSYLKREPVQKADSKLPKERSMVFYVALDNIAQTAASYAKQFGMPVNVQLPENLEPLAFSAGTEGSAVRVDGLIPAETVQSLISAVMQAKENMMGARGGAGQAP
jgi:hypothetical protein